MILLFFGNPIHHNDGLGYFLYKSLKNSKITDDVFYIPNLNSLSFFKDKIQKEKNKIVFIDSIKVSTKEEGKIFYYDFIFNEKFLYKHLLHRKEVSHNEILLLFLFFLQNEFKKKRIHIITIGISEMQPFRIGIDLKIRKSIRILKEILIKDYLYENKRHIR